MDLVVGTSGGPLVWMHRQGTYVDETAARVPPLPGVGGARVAPIDFDADGDMDLALACWSGAAALLLQNQGAGTFTDVTAQRLPPVTGQMGHILALDFDGDLDTDLWLSPSGFDAVLLRNDGAGTFTVDASDWRGDLGRGELPATVDVDGDRFVDVHVTTGLLRNLDGRSLRSLTSNRTFSKLLVFDADADGDLDVLSTQGLWRGEGGQFSLEPSPVPGPAAAGDLDGDGAATSWCALPPASRCGATTAPAGSRRCSRCRLA